MPLLETIDCVEPACLWTFRGVNGNAEPILNNYVQVNVRWVNRQSVALDPLGNSIAVDATLAIGQDVPLHSMFWEGPASSLDFAPLGGPPVPPGNVMEVVTSNRATDLKGRFTRYELGLKRWNGTLPAVLG